MLADQIDDRGDPLSVLAKGILALQAGNYDEARRLAVRAKANYQGSPDSSFDILIAQSYHRQGSYKEAVGAFENARETSEAAQDDAQHSILTNLGASYYAWAQTVPEGEDRLALLEKAAEIEAKARALASDEPTTFANSAITLNALGRHDEALAALAGYDGEESGEIELQRAFAHGALGNPALAFDHLSQALALDPTLALTAALSDSLASLRADPGFLEIFVLYLPEDTVDELVAMWE
jgi:tetratricopeptide (TPR) repeat protein